MPNFTHTQSVGDSVPKVDDEIAVGEDLDFQRKWWRFERRVWIAFTALIILALAGVFGRGPLAKASIHAGDGSMSLSYDRIQRTGTPSVLRVELDKPPVQNGEIHILASESIARELGAQRIIPQPQSTMIGEGGYTYTFPVSTLPAAIELALEPTGPGRFVFKISIPGGTGLEGHIIVLP